MKKLLFLLLLVTPLLAAAQGGSSGVSCVKWKSSAGTAVGNFCAPFTIQAGSSGNVSFSKSGSVLTLDIGLTSLGVGTAPTACGTATGCIAATEASTAGTPTAGQDYMRFDSTLHGIKFSFNNGADGQAFLSGTSFGVGTPSASCGNGICFAELAAPTGLAGYDLLYPDSTAHRWKVNNNNGGAVQLVVSGVDINTSDQVTGVNGVNIQRVTMTADWTCGTGGTVTACASGTIVGASGTPMTIVLPSVAGKSYHWQCDGVVGQATAATANTWQVEMATNAATNLEATYSMATAATASAYGALTGLATTTITAIGANWTLGGTATKMPFHIQGSIEGASASGTTINLRITGGNNADLITIYRGATCSVAPF